MRLIFNDESERFLSKGFIKKGNIRLLMLGEIGKKIKF